MMKAGIYPHLPSDSYHADPCETPSLSASVAKVLLAQTPAHARLQHPRLSSMERDDAAVMDVGRAAHALMLGDPADFVIVEADDWRTKAAKEARDEARAAGKIPMLAARFDQVAAMVAAGRAQLAAHPDAEGVFTSKAGASEVSIFWQDGPAKAPIWCRARVDWLPTVGPVVWDYKTTTSAHPNDWARQTVNLGHDIQAGFYCRGLRKLGWAERPVFKFVVQEVEPPYALAIHTLDPFWADRAEQMASHAINLWSRCLHNDSWPGYVGATYHLEMPGYHEKKWDDRMDREQMTAELTALVWQAPDADAARRVIEMYKKETGK